MATSALISLSLSLYNIPPFFYFFSVLLLSVSVDLSTLIFLILFLGGVYPFFV